MIYAIGWEPGYSQYLAESPECDPVMKKGRTADYAGGSVWRTPEEAQQHCKADYKVYGVIADWETDTVPSSDGQWHDLLVDAKIVDLDAIEQEPISHPPAT